MRCAWASGSEAMIAYHDTESGVPLHDDRRLFEMLTLEGAQAGLSWSTILHRRDAVPPCIPQLRRRPLCRHDRQRSPTSPR